MVTWLGTGGYWDGNLVWYRGLLGMVTRLGTGGYWDGNLAWYRGLLGW